MRLCRQISQATMAHADTANGTKPNAITTALPMELGKYAREGAVIEENPFVASR